MDEVFLPVEDNEERLAKLRTFLFDLYKVECLDESKDGVAEDFTKRLYEIIIIGGSPQRYYRPAYGLVTSMVISISASNVNEQLQAEEQSYEKRPSYEEVLSQGLQGIEEWLKAIGNCITKHLENAINVQSDLSDKDWWATVSIGALQRLLKSAHSLCNIVSSENARCTSIYMRYGEVDASVRGLYSSTADILNKSNESLNQAHKAAREANTAKTDIVTILSIFAAVIIMVSGGIAVIGNAVVALQYVNAAKAAAVALICIFGLFNSLFVLLFIVSRITNKSLAVFCRHSEYEKGRAGEGCKGCKTKWCCGLRKVARRLPYFFWFDFALIIGIVVAVAISCRLTLIGGEFAADHVDLIRVIFFGAKNAPPLFW